MKIRNIIAIVLLFGGLAALVLCVLQSLILHIQNPDMTELRLMIEYPKPYIGAVISIVAFYAGRAML